MDPNNSKFIVEDVWLYSDFTAASSIEMDTKQMAEKIQKLENVIMKNANNENSDQSSSMMQMGLKIDKQFGKLENKMNEMKKENDGLRAELNELKEQLTKKGHEMEEMKKTIAELKTEKNEGNHTIKLAMTERIAELESIEMKNNKFNEEDCGSKLIISQGGLVVMHDGPYKGDNCVRTIWPIPTLNSSIHKNRRLPFTLKSASIGIGFCDQKFPLEGQWLGYGNSIGIYRKGRITIDGYMNEFENGDGNFKDGNFVGIGIIQKPSYPLLECFATWNGKLLGKAALPPKFANIQLFPVVNLEYDGELIRANFEKDKWIFKKFEHVFE